MDIRKIIEAWTISHNPTERQVELAQKRSEICKECPSMKQVFSKEWTSYCGECGCPISKKIFTNNYDECPIGKWGDIDKNYFGGIKETKTLL